MGYIIQDYISAFIATCLVILSFIFLKEIRKSFFLIILFIAIGIFSLWLGISKINRDNEKERINEQRRLADSVRFHNMESTIILISENYKKDTSRFSDFKKQLENKFHIKDSGNIPIKTVNINAKKVETMNIY